MSIEPSDPQERQQTIPAQPFAPAALLPIIEAATATQNGVTGERLPLQGFPIAGIGTLTGRLAAFDAYFSTMPVGTDPAPGIEKALDSIFVLLRTWTGHDFSKYKPSNIYRHIERGMAFHRFEEIDSYVLYLQETPAEVERLFRDLLIGVTSFFRDPDAFHVLEEQVIPKLLAGKAAGGVIRVWTPGCSTGEESYSIAILLMEQIEALKQSHTVQIFATDIDSRAIAAARAGLYPASIAADVSPERLARFFTAENDGTAYRINKRIRDSVVFSEHDVIEDTPFSRLDLITCRNLLIYMGAELQRNLIPLFHSALEPDGWLFLGTSEGIGEFDPLFTVLDRNARVYRRKKDRHCVRSAAPDRFPPPVAAVNTALRRDTAMSDGPWQAYAIATSERMPEGGAP